MKTAIQKIALAFALFVALAWPARAGVAEGVAAYEQRDYATALREFRPPAAAGNAQAQYNLGLMHANGEGVAADPAEAVRWYRLAAAQNYAFAQYSLGFMHADGQGVDRDYAAAARWYHLAAIQNFAPAQATLGVMYATGQGVPRDYIHAHAWFDLAAVNALPGGEAALGETQGAHGAPGEKGFRDFMIESRDELARKMTPRQVEEAKIAAFRSCPGSI